MKRKEIYNEVLNQFESVTGVDLNSLDNEVHEEVTDEIYDVTYDLNSNTAADTERVTLSEIDALDEEYEVEITKILEFDFQGKTYYIILWYDCN